MMGGNGAIPLLGQQQQQQQMMAHQMVVQVYLNLIPVVASNLLGHADMYADRDEIPERIAEEAWKVTRAAVKKIGINIPDQAPGATQNTQ